MKVNKVELSTAKAPSADMQAARIKTKRAVAEYVASALQAVLRSPTGSAKLTAADTKRLTGFNIKPGNERIRGRRAFIIADQDSSQRKSDFSIVIPALSILSGLHKDFSSPAGGGMLDTLTINVLYIGDGDASATPPKLSPFKMDTDGAITHADYTIAIDINGEPPKKKSKVAGDILKLMRDDHKAALEKVLGVDLPQQMIKRLSLGSEIANQTRRVATHMVNKLNSGDTADIKMHVPLDAIERIAQSRADGSDPVNPEDKGGVYGTEFAKLVAVVRTSVRGRLEMQLVEYAFGSGSKGKGSKPTFAGFKAFAARPTGLAASNIKGISKAVVKSAKDALAQVGPSGKRSIYQPDPRRLMAIITGPAVVGKTKGQTTSMRSIFGARMNSPRFVTRLFARVEAIYPLVVHEALKELLDVDSGLSLVYSGFKLPRKAPEVLTSMFKGFMKDPETIRALQQVMSGATSPNSGMAETRKDKGAVPSPEETEAHRAGLVDSLKTKHGEKLADVKADRKQTRRKEAQQVLRVMKTIEKARIAAAKEANLKRLAEGRAKAAENRKAAKAAKLGKDVVRGQTKQAIAQTESQILPRDASPRTLMAGSGVPYGYNPIEAKPGTPLTTPGRVGGDAPKLPLGAKGSTKAAMRSAFTMPNVAQPAGLQSSAKAQAKKERQAHPGTKLKITLTPEMVAKRVLRMEVAEDAYGYYKTNPFFSGTSLIQPLFIAYQRAFPAAGLTLDSFKRILAAAHKKSLLKIVPINMELFDRRVTNPVAKQQEIDSSIPGLGSALQVHPAPFLARIRPIIEQHYLSLSGGQYNVPVGLVDLMNYGSTVEEREDIRTGVFELSRAVPEAVSVTSKDLPTGVVGQAPMPVVTIRFQLN